MRWKNCFDLTLFRSALRRWWPLGLALCAALMYQCMEALKNLGSFGNVYGDWGVALLNQALRSVFPAVSACAAAMLAYRYLHAVKDAAFMAALPVKRPAAFLSHAAAALSILLLAEVLCAVLTPLFSGNPAMVYPLMGQWLAITAILTAAYFGFASLCGVLTGHSLALPALYALGLYAAVALESSVRTMAQFLIFGLGSQQWKLTALSPMYYLKTCSYALVSQEPVAYDYYSGAVTAWKADFTGWGAVLGYLAAGAAFLALAALLLKKRPAEAAGSVIAMEVLKPVFRAGAALAGGCAAGMLLLRTVLGYSGYYAETGSAPKVLLLFFMLLLGGFAGWFGASMLLRKTLRVFDRNWLGFGVWAGLVLIAVLGCELDLFGVERAVPAEEKIGYVNLSCYEAGVYDTRFEQPENIAAVRQLHKTVVENKARFEREDDARYVTGGMGYGYGYHPGGTLVLRYYDRAGKLLMTREYKAPAGDMAWASNGNASYTGGMNNPGVAMLQDLVNTSEAMVQRAQPPESIPVSPTAPNWGDISFYFQDAMAYYRYQHLVTLSGEEAYELYTQAVRPDLMETSMGAARLLPADRQTLPEEGNLNINLSLNTADGGQWWYWYGNVTPDARRTIAWLADHGIELDENACYTPAWEELECGDDMGW